MGLRNSKALTMLSSALVLATLKDVKAHGRNGNAARPEDAKEAVATDFFGRKVVKPLAPETIETGELTNRNGS